MMVMLVILVVVNVVAFLRLVLVGLALVGGGLRRDVAMAVGCSATFDADL